MNKSILALAVLAAFAGAASAQSSVTLYGRVEVNVTNSKPGNLFNGGNDVTRMDDGGDNSGIGGSRWGLRGTEDLGGGLKAYFVLESGLRGDTGAAGSATVSFNRQAYVALGSASLGDVRLGRQESISRLINSGYSDASGIGELKIDESVQNGRQLFNTFGQRVDNTVAYITPNFGGFQVQAMVGAGEAANARYQGIMASYKAGPVGVALGYEEYDKFGARTGSFNKTFNVGGNYNFGFAQLFAGYQDVKDAGNNAGLGLTGLGATGTATTAAFTAATALKDQQSYTVGVMVPFGALQIRGVYVNADYDLVNGQSRDIQKYGLSARYALSKRTTLYSAYTERVGSNNADDSFVQKREVTLLGVYHTF